MVRPNRSAIHYLAAHTIPGAAWAGAEGSWRLLTAAAAGLEVGEAQQEQQHPGADDRADDADGVEAVHAHVVVLDEVLQEAADEGTDDAEHDRADDPDRVTTGHEQARDRATDEAYYQQDDN